MMNKNAYAFVVIEEKVMAFKHAKDKGLIPIFESFAPYENIPPKPARKIQKRKRLSKRSAHADTP
ncbi:hypothetical protein TH0233_08260 [Helicobacter pylori]